MQQPAIQHARKGGTNGDDEAERILVDASGRSEDLHGSLHLQQGLQLSTQMFTREQLQAGAAAHHGQADEEVGEQGEEHEYEMGVPAPPNLDELQEGVCCTVYAVHQHTALAGEAAVQATQHLLVHAYPWVRDV